MSFLKVDIEGAKAIAAKLQQNAQARESDISTLSAQVRPEAVWEGTAATAYQEKYEQWKSAETHLIEALRDLGTVVNQIISDFDHINTYGASAMGH